MTNVSSINFKLKSIVFLFTLLILEIGMPLKKFSPSLIFCMRCTTEPKERQSERNASSQDWNGDNLISLWIDDDVSFCTLRLGAVPYSQRTWGTIYPAGLMQWKLQRREHDSSSEASQVIGPNLKQRTKLKKWADKFIYIVTRFQRKSNPLF